MNTKHEIRTRATPWKTIILLCGKCARKLDGGYGPKKDDPLRSALRRTLKGCRLSPRCPHHRDTVHGHLPEEGRRRKQRKPAGGDLRGAQQGHAEIWQICLAPADRHDTYTAAGKAFLDMLAVFAEFETNLRNEQQQAERIAAAKPRGVYRGRRC